jgi:hypothetical protein
MAPMALEMSAAGGAGGRGDRSVRRGSPARPVDPVAQAGHGQPVGGGTRPRAVLSSTSKPRSRASTGPSKARSAQANVLVCWHWPALAQNLLPL